jgi:hypothetical protein
MSDETISRADAEAIETLILESLSDADRDQAAAVPGSSMEQAATAELRMLKPLLARIQAAAAPRPAEYVGVDGLGQRVVVPGNVTFAPWHDDDKG